MREGLNVLTAEMQTLHLLPQNTLHMDLVKGCFYIFSYKASFVFLLVCTGLILVSFTLLSTGSNPSEARIKNEAPCHVYIFCSLQHNLS